MQLSHLAKSVWRSGFTTKSSLGFTPRSQLIFAMNSSISLRANGYALKHIHHENLCLSLEYRGRIYNVSFLAWPLILNGCSIFTSTRCSFFVLWLVSALTCPHTTTARLEHMRKMLTRLRNWIRLLTSRKELVNSMSRSFSEGKTQMFVAISHHRRSSSV